MQKNKPHEKNLLIRQRNTVMGMRRHCFLAGSKVQCVMQKSDDPSGIHHTSPAKAAGRDGVPRLEGSVRIF
jgi:hypothetical protein